MQLAYLATPYSRYPAGIEASYVDACKLAARLLPMLDGALICPIVHSHSLAVHGGIDPRDLGIWWPHNFALLQACDVLIVAHLEGWEYSIGINREVKFCQARHKPIFDLDPLSLAMVRRRAPLIDAPLAHGKSPSEQGGASA